MNAALSFERQDVALARRQVIQHAPSLKPVMAFTQEQAGQAAQMASSFPSDKGAVHRALLGQQQTMIENLRELGFGEAANRAEETLSAGSMVQRARESRGI